MSVEAWIEDASVLIKVESLADAYEMVKAAHKSKKINDRSAESEEKLLSNIDLVSYLNEDLYFVESEDGAIKITDGSIDQITDSFCNLFEALAPYVESGSFINIKDEEEGYLNLTFQDQKVDYEGDAY